MRPLTLAATLAAVALTACGREAPSGSTTTVGDLVIDHAFAYEPITAASGAAYFRIRNQGSTPDSVLEASSPVAASATFHGSNMGHLEALEIPPGGEVELRPGAMHLMLSNFSAPPAAGDSLRLTLRFAHAGSVTLALPVRRYGQ